MQRVSSMNSDGYIYGNDFRLGGEPLSRLQTVGSSSSIYDFYKGVFSGTLADGTPFVFSSFGHANTIAEVVSVPPATNISFCQVIL